MKSRVLTLVQSWLIIDFFADNRRHGDPSSSLTSTIFTQAFIGLVFAVVFLPEESDVTAVAYLAANLSLSMLIVGIGMLGDPLRHKRRMADELLVQTAPLPAGSLTLARTLHGGFYVVLVTTGMAIPPAILSYWVCGHRFVSVPTYLLIACALSGLIAGALAVIRHAAQLTLGEARAQLVAGTLNAGLLGGGFAAVLICLPHLDATAEALPGGRTLAQAWPGYWGAKIVHHPFASGWAWLALLGAGALVYLMATALVRMRRNRRARRPIRGGMLAKFDVALARGGPLLGATRFISTMIYRSPGFRARVLPLFGIPAAMVLLSLWDLDNRGARQLFLGMVLQFPAIFLPFLVAFLTRSDHENAGWIFATSPHRELTLYRRASLIAISTHVLLPIHAVAGIALVASNAMSLPAIGFGLALALFSWSLGVLACRTALIRLDAIPFSRDDDGEDGGAVGMGELMFAAIVLAGLGGGFALFADRPIGWVTGLVLAGITWWSLFQAPPEVRES